MSRSANQHVRFGSLAACQHHISRTAGFGCIPATRRLILRGPQFERLLSPKAVIQIGENPGTRAAANGQNQPVKASMTRIVRRPFLLNQDACAIQQVTHPDIQETRGPFFRLEVQPKRPLSPA